MKKLMIQFFTIFLFCGVTFLQAMFRSSTQLKKTASMQQQKGTRSRQQPIQVSGSSSFDYSPFTFGQTRRYSSTPTWGSWFYGKITGVGPEEYAKRDDLFERAKYFRESIESNPSVLKSFSESEIRNKIASIVGNYEDVVTWEKDGCSINNEFFKLLKFVVKLAIFDAKRTGYFYSGYIRIVLEMCGILANKASQQYYKDQREIEEIVTLLCRYLLQRYKYNEQSIPIADLLEICFLIDEISEKSTSLFRFNVSFTVQNVQTGEKFDSALKAFLNKIPGSLNTFSLFDLLQQIKVAEFDKQGITGKVFERLLKKSIKKMFSVIRMHLIDSNDQAIFTKLENLMNLSLHDLVRFYRPSSARINEKKRAFYFTEEGPNENDEESIEELKRFLNVSGASNEMVLKAVTLYIKKNHPDKFSPGLTRDQKTKEFQLFMGKYDKAIEKLKSKIKSERQQQQQWNRE